MRGGERHAVIARGLNDQRGGGFCCESVQRLQFHHPMAKGPNDAPTTRGRSYSRRHGAETDHPHGQERKLAFQEIKPARQMIEAARLRAGKKRERDNAHCFLGVICAVTVRHPGCAENLQFAEKRMHNVRRETMQRHEKQKHQERAENKACEWGSDHGAQ